MQLSPGNCALASGLAIEAKQLPELVLTSGARPVDLVAENKNRTVGELLVCQQGLQLALGLFESSPITRVDKEDDGVDCWEIIFPHSSRLVVAAKIKGGESDPVDAELLRGGMEGGDVLGHPVILEHVEQCGLSSIVQAQK